MTCFIVTVVDLGYVWFHDGRNRFPGLNHRSRQILALVKDIEIVGEAAYRISDTAKDKHTDIPWDDIIGMRHRLVHAYFDINLDILWSTVTDDLPALVLALKRIV